MIATIQRTVLTAWLLAVLACLVWFTAAPSLAPAAGLVLLLFGHAAVLAVEFLWMHAANRIDGAPRASLRQLTLAWWGECWHAPRVFLWRQPLRSRHWPSTASGTAASTNPQTGVLLIHGFFCNRGLWNRWMERLAAMGTPVMAVDLEPAFGSIDDYRSTIERAVSLLERATGNPPVVVAHSMGGLALRRWWADSSANDTRLRHVITLGTPHSGTRLAALALSINGRQMRQDSPWLSALRALEPHDRAQRLTCFFSHTDNIVFPASTATMPGADNRHLPAIAHVAMVDHPDPWAELLRVLRT